MRWLGRWHIMIALALGVAMREDHGYLQMVGLAFTHVPADIGQQLAQLFG